MSAGNKDSYTNKNRHVEIKSFDSVATLLFAQWNLEVTFVLVREQTMNAVNRDLITINFQFLMLVRECAKRNLLEAIWRFRMDKSDAERISDMTLEQIQDLAACGRSTLAISPLPETPAHIPANVVAALLPIPEALDTAQSSEEAVVQLPVSPTDEGVAR
jgi:hypothetical protein